MTTRDGMTYAPRGESKPVVKDAEFIFASAYFDHGHINGMTNGLLEAGGTLKYAYDPDPVKLDAFCSQYPQAEKVDDLERILEDKNLHLVAAAAIPCERGPIGMEVMDAGKDYFTDKSPFTTLEQLEIARKKVKETKRKYLVYYGERMHNEAAIHAGNLIKQGVIGRVLQLINLAPHRLNKANRPEWFFQKEKYGGILTDIGSHQFEQFLHYAGATDASVNFARVDNLNNPDKQEFEDFGEASLTADNGASFYCRVDWFNPDGLRTWGDGRSFILGTKGTIEIRKLIDVGRDGPGNLIFLVDDKKEEEIKCEGRIGFPLFGELILDVLNRTENFMTQDHAFKAAELSMKAQRIADALRCKDT